MLPDEAHNLAVRLVEQQRGRQPGAVRVAGQLAVVVRGQLRVVPAIRGRLVLHGLSGGGAGGSVG